MLCLLFLVSCGISAALSDEFATGMLSQECLKCLCMNESGGCVNLPCQDDRGTLECGYFTMHEAYYTDCKPPGSNITWEDCSADKECASQCVQDYMAKYARHYGCPDTCEAYARMHKGGPNGCHMSYTLLFWHDILQLPGCSELV